MSRLLNLLLGLTVLLGSAVAHAGTVTYVYTDPQGTPLAEANASGVITATFDYKPYGSQALGSPKAGPGYTGHVNDPDTGFVYMQARYYDPSTGRFLSIDPDPNEDPFGFNDYLYANANPIENIDPDGRETNPVSGASYITDSELRTNKSNPSVGKFGHSRSTSNWNGGFHNGVDIAARSGTSLVSPISGKVIAETSASHNKKGGNVIWIQKNEGNHIVVIGMAHLSEITPKAGTEVSEGQAIAKSGTTGNAAGLPAGEQHVHLTVRVDGKLTNPQNWFDKHPSESVGKKRNGNGMLSTQK